MLCLGYRHTERELSESPGPCRRWCRSFTELDPESKGHKLAGPDSAQKGKGGTWCKCGRLRRENEYTGDNERWPGGGHRIQRVWMFVCVLGLGRNPTQRDFTL